VKLLELSWWDSVAEKCRRFYRYRMPLPTYEGRVFTRSIEGVEAYSLSRRLIASMKVDLDTFADSILLLRLLLFLLLLKLPRRRHFPLLASINPSSSIFVHNFHPLPTPPAASPLPSSATSWGMEATPPVSTLNLFPAHTLSSLLSSLLSP
jgi:hypothetical protein